MYFVSSRKVWVRNTIRISFLLLFVLTACGHAPGPHQIHGLKPGAVIYAAVPPLFGQDPLPAVTRKLDYLQDLGVDAILLSPIQTTDDPSGISYAITDYFSIRPDFGTLEDLKRLVREAGRRGIQVMMDFVPNHTSAAHPWFEDALRNGPASPTYSFYEWDALGRPEHYFDWERLPNLNYDHPAVLATMEKALAYWVETAGVAGYRLDAAWGIRERTPQAWPAMIRRLRRVDPDVIMLAEAGARDPYYAANGFDLAYDWTAELGQWAWKPVFEFPADAGRRLHEALVEHQDQPGMVLRFLNNNDTGARFITRYGLKMLRPAAVLQHTVPGIPLLFTGDEIGAEYEPYEDRPPLHWHDRYGLRQLYRRLAALREDLRAIRDGAFIPLPPKAPSPAYAFLRVADREHWALVVVNFGPAAVVTLAPPSPHADWVAHSRLKDALSRQQMTGIESDGRELKLHLDAFAALVLIPE